MSVALLSQVHKNIDQRKLISIAQKAGVTVTWAKGGEIKFEHPAFGRLYRVNSRRQDCPQKLVSAIRQLLSHNTRTERAQTW